MPLRNTREHYGLVAVALHWLMAALLLALFVSGLYMVSLEYYESLYHRLPSWHKSSGLLVLLLLLVRIGWRLADVRPAVSLLRRPLERFVANIVHMNIYIVIALTGVSGYWIAAEGGKGVGFFSLFELPGLMQEVDYQYAVLIDDAHFYLAMLLAVLVVLHVTAALKHHYIDKDGSLRRMTTYEYKKLSHRRKQ